MIFLECYKEGGGDSLSILLIFLLHLEATFNHENLPKIEMLTCPQKSTIIDVTIFIHTQSGSQTWSWLEIWKCIVSGQQPRGATDATTSESRRKMGTNNDKQLYIPNMLSMNFREGKGWQAILYISNMLTSTPFIYSITRVINRAIIISESVIHW